MMNSMNLPAAYTGITEEESRAICGGETEVFGMTFDDTADAVLSIGGIALVSIVGFNLIKNIWNNVVLPAVQSAMGSVNA